MLDCKRIRVWRREEEEEEEAIHQKSEKKKKGKALFLGVACLHEGNNKGGVFPKKKPLQQRLKSPEQQSPVSDRGAYIQASKKSLTPNTFASRRWRVNITFWSTSKKILGELRKKEVFSIYFFEGEMIDAVFERETQQFWHSIWQLTLTTTLTVDNCIWLANNKLYFVRNSFEFFHKQPWTWLEEETTN